MSDSLESGGNSPGSAHFVQLMHTHIAEMLQTPAACAALLLCWDAAKKPDIFLIPASEMKQAHLELFHYWAETHSIHLDSEAYVPEYLAELDMEVRTKLWNGGAWQAYAHEGTYPIITEASQLFVIPTHQRPVPT